MLCIPSTGMHSSRLILFCFLLHSLDEIFVAGNLSMTDPGLIGGLHQVVEHQGHRLVLDLDLLNCLLDTADNISH